MVKQITISLKTLLLFFISFIFLNRCDIFDIPAKVSEDYELNNLVFEDTSVFDLSYEKIQGNLYEISKADYNKEEIKTRSQKNIFPQELNCIENKYFNYCKQVKSDYGKTYRTEVYLECIYDEEIFSNEINRLESFSGKYKNVVFVEDLFSLPAYIAIYNSSGQFEYALFDSKDNKIIYIYLHDIGRFDNIVFDFEYAPKKLLRDSSFDKEKIIRNSYNINAITGDVLDNSIANTE